MNHLSRSLMLVLLMSFLGTGASGAPVLGLIPANGAIGAQPGGLVGWGFTLVNTTDYVVITSADFLQNSTLGTFTDFIGPNFIVVGPPPESTVVSQGFDPVALTGIGSFAISSSATPGDTASGEIQLTYDLFSRSPNDPNFDPITDTISVGNLLNQPASVTAIPEPSSWLMIGAASAAFAFRRRRC